MGMVATGGLLPDLTIVLDIAPDTATARVGSARDRIEDRPLFYRERVRAGYLAAARGESDPGGARRRTEKLPLLSRSDRLDRCLSTIPIPCSKKFNARFFVSWQTVRGHDRVVESLRNSLRQGRFPHALLFVGARGHRQTQLSPAKWRRPFCAKPGRRKYSTHAGSARAAFRSKAGTHPDSIEVGRPEDKHELPISVIRELCDHFVLKPARGTAEGGDR